MNIWYFSPYAGGPGIGNAMRAFHLAKIWGEMGHSCTVFPARFHHLLATPSPLPERVDVDGVCYVSLPARRYTGNGRDRLLNITDYCVSMLSVKAEKPDTIIASSPHPFAILSAAWLARKHRAKLVFEVRDLWPLSLTEIAHVSPFHPFALLCAAAERFAYRYADVVASLLKNSEMHMRSKGLAPGKFIHVPNGIDPKAAEPAEPTTAAGSAAVQQIKSWHDEGRKVIIHPGSQGIPNALDLLIDAVAHLKDDNRFGVVLVGSGGETENLRRKAKGLEQIAFFPPVPKSEALWLTQHSDIGYAGGRNLPIYRFGTSFNKVADFLRFGLPVVEVIDTGSGFAAEDESPQSIASAIDEALRTPADAIRKRQQPLLRSLDYRQIAERYADAMA